MEIWCRKVINTVQKYVKYGGEKYELLCTVTLRISVWNKYCCWLCYCYLWQAESVLHGRGVTAMWAVWYLRRLLSINQSGEQTPPEGAVSCFVVWCFYLRLVSALSVNTGGSADRVQTAAPSSEQWAERDVSSMSRSITDSWDGRSDTLMPEETLSWWRRLISDQRL